MLYEPSEPRKNVRGLSSKYSRAYRSAEQSPGNAFPWTVNEACRVFKEIGLTGLHHGNRNISECAAPVRKLHRVTYEL